MPRAPLPSQGVTLQEGRLPHLPVQRLQYGSFARLQFRRRRIQAPRFAHHPGRSHRSSTRAELGSRDFYFRAPHGSLPPRVPDILVVRIGQLTTGDLTATTFSRSLTP
jgi:hypothetical protein